VIDFKEIKCVRLTPCQKEQAVNILRKGAIALKKWVIYYPPKKFRQFRNDVMSGNKNPQNLIPCNRLREFHSDLPAILAIREVRSDLDNRSVEQAVLENFAGMAKKHISQWSTDGDPNGLSKFDYLQEAYLIVLEAMYHYTREDIELSTFLWWALRNRMINITNQGNMFCPLTNSDLQLVVRYDRAKQKVGGTFEEIVESLGLSTDQGRHLGSILNKVFTENQLGSDRDRAGSRNGEASNDYTGYRSGIDTVSVDVLEEQEYVDDTLSRAGLTAMEREVLNAAMNPYRGWQTDFAKTHTNQVKGSKYFGQPYSRMRITQLLESARAKVAAILEKEAA
jgi:hypothetical protein